MELVLDPLTDYLQHTLESPLGHNTLEVQDEEHPVLSSMLAEWAKADAQYSSVTAPLGQFRISGGHLQHKDMSFPVDEVLIREVGGMLDIPSKYLERIRHTDLFADNINYWLNEHSDSESTVVYDNQSGRLSEVVDSEVFHRRIPKRKVVKVLADIIGDDKARVREVHDLPRNTVIKISSPQTYAAPLKRVGDITEAGMMLNLPKSLKAPVLSVYLHRLVCTNGMTNTSSDFKIEMRGLDGNEILENIRQTGSLVWARAQQMAHAVGDLDNEPVDNPRYMINVLAQEMHMTDRVRKYAVDIITEFVEKHPGVRLTRYDLVQLLTTLPHDTRLKENTRMAIQEGAGRMAARVAEEHRCGQCSQLIPDPQQLIGAVA